MTVQTLQLKPAAAEIMRSKAKIKVVFSGRRFGKTRMGLTWLLTGALQTAGTRMWFLAPTRVMAKQIAWQDLKAMVPQSWCRKVMESTLTLDLINGSRIQLAGADYADSLRGQKADRFVVDEFSYVQDLQSMWEAALLPMLGTSADGQVIFCSTPAGGGNFSAELWERAASTPDWERWNYPSVAGGWIKPEFVEQAKATMDPSLFRQEFFGSIEALLGAVYPAFGQKNIREVRDNGEPILLGVDFNRSPFCACILQVQGDTIAVLEEIVLMESDTREMALEVRSRYPDRAIYCCPDPTGSRKQTSSLGLSDHKILKEVGRMQICSPKAPWRIQDKVNATRLLLLDANGKRRLQVDPGCKRLVRSLRSLEFKPGMAVPDPNSDHGHMCDALGYAALALSKGLTPWRVGKGPTFW